MECPACATIASCRQEREAMDRDRVLRDQTGSGKMVSASLLAAILESSDDAILSKMLDGTVTSWNGAARRIFGYTADEMLGQPIAILAPPECADDLPIILARIRRGERIEHDETERRRKDGCTQSLSR
jgi:PAS domain S-box-containing protein